MVSSVEKSPSSKELSDVKTSDTEKPKKSSKRDDYNERKTRRKRSRSRERNQRRDNKKYKRSNKSDEEEHEHQRYYGDDLDKREISDRYWTKYPKKDDHKVGARYYDTEKVQEKEKEAEPAPAQPRQRKPVNILTSRTGGAYIPPAKLRMMQAEITDKSSTAYQRIAWEALKKSIHGYINKVNTSNIKIISRELLQENVIRGRGLLCKSIIQAQAASPTFTRIYAALVAVINLKFPNIGELLLNRLVLQFKRGYKQNNKNTCITAVSFIAHLVNQEVAHEILSLEILTLLVESPTGDSVEVAISFLKECGQKLTEVSSKGISAIFEMLRNILHEGKLEKRIQYMIEVMFQIRKDGFKDHAAVLEDHDIVPEDSQITHLITLDDVEPQHAEDILNVFKFDDKFEENEDKYKTLASDILGSDASGSESGSEDSEDEGDEEEQEQEDKDALVIVDKTETTLIALRRTIYLTIQSSLDFEECAHKLMKMELKPGQEIELCHMFLDCCAEQRTYEKFYGLLAQRFCQINNVYVTPFEQIFKDTYATTHRLDTNRLRNVSKFFAHLLFTDAIGWEVLEIIHLNEDETTSSSRIFIKILFQELSEYMGLAKLNLRLKDATLQSSFGGLFPRDNPKNTRFSINFFTSIGLGGLTDELRQHLKAFPKLPAVQNAENSSSSSSSDDDSSESSSSSDSSSTSGDSSSEAEDKKVKSKKLQKVDPKQNKKREETPVKNVNIERRPKDYDDNKKRSDAQNYRFEDKRKDVESRNYGRDEKSRYKRDNKEYESQGRSRDRRERSREDRYRPRDSHSKDERRRR